MINKLKLILLATLISFTTNTLFSAGSDSDDSSNYLNNYNLFFNITNILDKKYETALDYSQMNRSFNFGIKKTY